MFVNESYKSENDPDYEIGETTCDFEESCDESGTDKDENFNVKGFLCKKCKDECIVECNREWENEIDEVSIGESDSEAGNNKEDDDKNEEDGRAEGGQDNFVAPLCEIEGMPTAIKPDGNRCHAKNISNIQAQTTVCKKG